MKKVILGILILSILVVAIVSETQPTKSWKFWQSSPPAKVKTTDIYAYNYLVEMHSAWSGKNGGKPQSEVKDKANKGNK